MWPFAKRSVNERLEEVETAVKQLRSDRKTLETEWEQVYEKYRVAMSKLARRDMRESERLETRQEAPGRTNGDLMTGQPEADAIVLQRVFGAHR